MKPIGWVVLAVIAMLGIAWWLGLPAPVAPPRLSPSPPAPTAPASVASPAPAAPPKVAPRATGTVSEGAGSPAVLEREAQLVWSGATALTPPPDRLRDELVGRRGAALRFSPASAGRPDITATIAMLGTAGESAGAVVISGQVVGEAGSLARLEFKDGTVSGLMQNPGRHEALRFESDGSGLGSVSIYALHHALRCAVCEAAMKDVLPPGAGAGKEVSK